MRQGDDQYFLKRVSEELAAAKRATNPQAKRAHHEMANRYLMLFENESPGLGCEQLAVETRASA